MRKKAVIFIVLALVAMAAVPSLAFGLTNEYGLNFAGSSTCLSCHPLGSSFDSGTDFTATVHGRFAKQGLVPSAPAGWTIFQAAGDPPVVAGTAPARWNGGGTYSVAGDTWVTLGDYVGGAATEYLFWKGSADANILPWNLVEGLIAEPTGEWLVGSEAPAKGLYDVQYSCQRCHMLGATIPKASATTVATIPNPAATTAVTATTARQWARTDGTSTADFMSDPTVSYPGLGIQCEQCHGTGVKTTTAGVRHMNSGTQLSSEGPGNSISTLGQSQVCGQCHGSYTNVAGTLGIYGYTPNLPLRDFVDINGLSGGYSYTQIPTEEEFLANPTKYFMFPNGSNAKGGHFYYDEWAASAHSYRGALTSTSADAMTFQAAGHGHYATSQDPTLASGCYKCHTGEGYLKSKNAAIAKNFTPAPDKVGFMGQECVTCHNSHPSGVGAEDVIREPDPAGVRSATGLAVGNSSICEDCHNWQYEVQGTTPVVKPLAAISSRGGASHPQREALAGRVMLEIPAATSNFMPGVTCEQCHMVRTNKAANRISHGMKPMLPGDAKAWNAAAGAGYAGEDSCSGCHAGENRDQLQANIDTWQTDTTAAADAAAAAITAVTSASPAPAEYSLTDASKPGYVLIGKATWNYKAFINDASSGVHNPMYMQEGLAKAEQMAKSVGGSFDHVMASTTIAPGGTTFVSGKVLNGDGSPAEGASLALFAGGTATGDTTVADASGHFAFMVSPGTATSFTVVWARSSAAITNLTSDAASVTVVKPRWVVTLGLSKTVMPVNTYVRVRGTVMTKSGAAGTGTVMIQRRPAAGGTWVTVKTPTLSGTGRYSVSVKMTVRKTWAFRAKMLGDTDNATAYSAVKKVKVF